MQHRWGRTVFYGELLIELMEQIKAESSEKKRTGILLQFWKAQVERDKSFKVVPVDSIPEEEQEEMRNLLKQREEIRGSTLRECTLDDGEHIDWSGCESQKIDDELRRRGSLVGFQALEFGVVFCLLNSFNLSLSLPTSVSLG